MPNAWLGNTSETDGGVAYYGETPGGGNVGRDGKNSKEAVIAHVDPQLAIRLVCSMCVNYKKHINFLRYL